MDKVIGLHVNDTTRITFRVSDISCLEASEATSSGIADTGEVVSKRTFSLTLFFRHAPEYRLDFHEVGERDKLAKMLEGSMIMVSMDFDKEKEERPDDGDFTPKIEDA